MEVIIFCIVCGLWCAVLFFLAGFCLGGVYYADICGGNSSNNPEPCRNNRGLDGCKEREEKA